MKTLDFRFIMHVPMALLLCMSLGGCSKDTGTVSDNDRRVFTLSYHVLPFDCDGDGDVSKSYLEDVISLVGGVNVLVYDGSGHLCEDCSGYSDLESLSTLCLPSHGSFAVYFFANVPDLSGSYPLVESGLSDFGYSYGSYDEILGSGLPMAYSQTVNSSEGGLIHVWFKRLVTRLELSFDKSALSPLHRQGTCLKSLRVCQGALDIHPFAPGGSRAGTCTSDADKALEGDIDILNSGGTVYIYLLENMQGQLLPASASQTDKVPDRLEVTDPSDLKLLSFIEARCALDCDDWSGDDVVLRHYIGGSCDEDYNCSFDIFRSRSRKIRLFLKENDPLLEPWRFCSEGKLTCKGFSFSTDTVRVQKHFNGSVTVTAPFDFVMDSECGHCTILLENSSYDQTSERFSKTFAISTQEVAAGLLPPGQKASPIIESLHLHSLTRSQRDTSIRIEVYNRISPLTIRCDGEGNVRVLGENPLGLGFSSRLVFNKVGDVVPVSTVSRQCTPSVDMESAENVIGTIPVQLEGAYSMLVDLYPLWDTDCDMYMGTGNKASFGPGASYSPGNCHPSRMVCYSFSDYDTASWAEFVSNREASCDISNTVNDSTSVPKVFFTIGEDRSAESMKDQYMFSWGCPTAAFSRYSILPSSSSGHNNCDNYQLSGFERCPFYFTNGCLQGYHMYLFTHRWNSSNMMERIEVDCYRPGRDVLSGFGDNEVKIVFSVHGDNNWGSIDISVEEAEYSYGGINLLINGCSCWPGGSPSPYGVRDAF